jgi:transposase, IS5 family
MRWAAKAPSRDGKTLATALDQVARWTGQRYQRVLVDQGNRGHGPVGGAAVMIPGKKVHPSADALRRHQTLCKRRSAIEAMIGHLKSDHSMGSNYLKGRSGDTHHALLAGIGFNLMLLLRAWVGHFGPLCFGPLSRSSRADHYALLKMIQAPEVSC